MDQALLPQRRRGLSWIQPAILLRSPPPVKPESRFRRCIHSVKPQEESMKRSAQAIWQGNLTEGGGSLSSQSGAIAGLPYSFKGRFQDESGKSGTNPEELIAAAHAGCFAMQLSHFLAENGTPASKIDATATVTVDPDPAGGFTIKSSALNLVGTVPGIDEAKFKELADKAKATCPVSRALGAIEVSLTARLG
jgi:osmotically inducible protein OsmC